MIGAIPGRRLRLPDWLNPWWSDVREVQSPLNAEDALNALRNASSFLRGPLGRVLGTRTLIVFHESWWHLRRPWVVARITTAPAGAGSVVTMRLARTWFQSAFITFFVVFGLGTPVVFFVGALVAGHPAALPWWAFIYWEVQDAAIYAACMALNTAAVRRDTSWLVSRITEVVSGLSIR